MCSYAGQDNGKDDFITISIDPEDSQIVSIADFFEKIAIVPLETNDTILINAVYNIIPLNKRLYILDRRSSSVFIFLIMEKPKRLSIIKEMVPTNIQTHQALRLMEKRKNCM